MAKNNNIQPVPKLTTDFTEADIKAIEAFEADGCPGLANIDDVNLTRMLELYLSGKTYRQISVILRVPKPVILYMSHKFKWLEMRTEYLAELEFTIRNRVLDAKLASQDFLLQIMHLYQKKIGSKLNKYLSTDNEDFANAIDLKEVDKYLKTVDMLHKLTSEGKGSDGKPAVGLNLGEGTVTIKKVGPNEVEITPKDKAVASILKQHADFRRNMQKGNISSDITIKEQVEETETKGEVSEEE